MKTSSASSSNAQETSVGLANETGGNAPPKVSGAKAIVELKRSIRTPKPQYPKDTGEFTTWSNITTQSEEDASKSNNNKIVLATKGDTFQTGILAVLGCIAGKEIQDLIVDIGSPVSRVSSQFYETIINETQLQPIKGQYLTVNGSFLNIKKLVEFTITFDKIKITHKFLCVGTKLFFPLLGYNFICKSKINILTCANCLLVQNVPIITHLYKRRNNVRENMGRHISANETYEKIFEYEVPMLNELNNATTVAPAITPDAALIETNGPTKTSAEQSSLQLTDSDKSKVQNVMTLIFANRHEQVFVNIAQPRLTVAGLYTIEPVALHRDGTQRYYQRPRLKKSTINEF